MPQKTAQNPVLWEMQVRVMFLSAVQPPVLPRPLPGNDIVSFPTSSRKKCGSFPFLAPENLRTSSLFPILTLAVFLQLTVLTDMSIKKPDSNNNRIWLRRRVMKSYGIMTFNKPPINSPT